MSVVVPIVHEQESSLGQVFHSLGVLESVVTDVFASVVTRTGAEKAKLASLNARVRFMAAQISQVAANKQQATCVSSPARFPAQSSQTGPVFTPAACLEIQAHTQALAPLPSGRVKASADLPGKEDVSELFWALDHSRQSLPPGCAVNSDKTLSSVSSLVPFGSKPFSQPSALPKETKSDQLGPQPLPAVLPGVEKASLLFRRSHAAPPSLGTPTDLPLPKLAWVSSSSTVPQLTFFPQAAIPAPQPSILSTPAREITTFAVPLIEIKTTVMEIKPIVMVQEPVVERVMVERKEEKKAEVVVVAERKVEKVEVVPVVEKKQEGPPRPVAVRAPASGSRGDLLRDIERQAQERERRRAEQQATQASVVVHVAPAPSTPCLPNMSPMQDAALRVALEQRRLDLEEDDIWQEADDF